MENPFLQINKSNNILRIGILIIIVISIFLSILLHNTLSESKMFQNSFLNWKSDKDKQIEELEKKLKDKQELIDKMSLIKNVIKDQIVLNGVPEKTAEKYAMTIMKESAKHGTSPLVQTALLQSESSFKCDPSHDIKTVIGLGGIYWNVWGEDLKKQKIASNISQLKNPYVNIRASSYILGKYMDQTNNNPKESLAHYKGYCKLGKKQANEVMKLALSLKRKVENGEQFG